MNFKRRESKELYIEKTYINPDGSELPVLASPSLERFPEITHFFTTRKGGVSKGFRESLNFSAAIDERENVMENFDRVAYALGISRNDIVCTQQEHTANIVKAERCDGGRGLSPDFSYSEVDGIVTDVPGLAISAYTADCPPVLMYDPVKRALGAVHSGWRGTAKRIAALGIEKLTEFYGTDPSDVVCAVGPSICMDCYEVGAEVAEVFIREFPQHTDSILFDKKKDGKYLLNLWKCIEISLEEAGVRPENISVTDICSCCNSDLLFSHRATGGKRGIMGAFIMINKDGEEE